MYKHVAKFTKELREFSYDGLDLEAAVNKKFRKEDEKLIASIDKIDESKQFFCSLCKKWVSSHPNNARNHAQSRGHTKRLIKWKAKYRTFMKEQRRIILSSSRPKNKFWKRLMYYKQLHNFQTDV